MPSAGDRHRRRLALEARLELAEQHRDRLSRDGITTTAYVEAVNKAAGLKRRLDELDAAGPTFPPAPSDDAPTIRPRRDLE